MKILGKLAVLVAVLLALAAIWHERHVEFGLTAALALFVGAAMLGPRAETSSPVSPAGDDH